MLCFFELDEARGVFAVSRRVSEQADQLLSEDRRVYIMKLAADL